MLVLGTIADAGAQNVSSAELQRQITELKTQVTKLQAAVAQLSGAQSSSAMGSARKKGSAMPMMMDKGEMGMPPEGMKMPPGMMEKMEKMDMMEMSGMKSGGGMSGMNKSATDSGMTGMGGGSSAGMASMPGTPSSISALPGFPGVSHLYHVGAVAFFLDQSVLSLSDTQQGQLGEIRTRALLARSESDRRLEQLEEELWTLTAADQPEAAKIETKIQEIERTRTTARMSFIRSVGEATKVLTPAQRQQLLGVPSK